MAKTKGGRAEIGTKKARGRRPKGSGKGHGEGQGAAIKTAGNFKVPRAHLTGGVKKPHRFKPGTVALRAIMKPDAVGDELEPEVGARGTERRPISKLAASLHVLPLCHDDDDKNHQFQLFLRGVRDNSEMFLIGNTEFFETHHAIWCSTKVLYTGQRARYSAVTGNPGNEMLDRYTGCAITIANKLRIAMGKKKPVAVICSGHLKGKAHVHSVVLVINPAGEHGTYVRDSLPVNQTCVSRKIFEILNKLAIRRVKLIGELQAEEEGITYTDCIKECYRHVGDLLENNANLSKFKLYGRTRLYDVKGKKEIKQDG